MTRKDQLSYINSGDYKIQEWTTSVKFFYNGKVLWQSGGTNVPGFISLKRGENIEGVLRANEKPNYDWFGGGPKFLQKPSAGTGPQSDFGLGQSHVRATGIK